MEVDYDAVNESITESIMEDIGGMNVVEFVDSLSGKDHADASSIVDMLEQSTIEENELSLALSV